jgi:hypothetical protein
MLRRVDNAGTQKTSDPLQTILRNCRKAKIASMVSKGWSFSLKKNTQQISNLSKAESGSF